MENKKEKTFEENLTQLEEIVKKLENGATEDQKKLIKKIGNELDI